MAILIDGYNLLHATGYIAAGSNYDSLEGPRRAFLSFLRQHLTTEEAWATTVVFDAAKAPSGLPREIAYGSIKVLFAHTHAEADDLIEELIRADNVPHNLTVVSSDHRLHQAARRRRATIIDSDQWYWAIRERQAEGDTSQADPVEARRDTALNEDEINEWLAAFGEIDEQSFAVPDASAQPSANVNESRQPTGEIDNPFPPDYGDELETLIESGSDDIFPPGYGEDLLRDNDDDR